MDASIVANKKLQLHMVANYEHDGETAPYAKLL